MSKTEKGIKKMKDIEIFEHKVGDRTVTVAFKLDGDKVTEVVHTIQDPSDIANDNLAQDILIERLKKKRKNGHYVEMDDVDILDYAAKGLAEEKVAKLEARLAKKELKKQQEANEQLHKILEDTFSNLVFNFPGGFIKSKCIRF